MDDAKIGHDIRETAYQLMSGKRGLVPSDADLGRAAREVLAKPEATREAVRAYIAQQIGVPEHCPTEQSVTNGLELISHFAPPARPKMMIEGMSVEDIAAEFRNSWHSPDRPATDQWYSQHVARVAHRLANTPVPERDPDAYAKRLAWEYYCATNPNPKMRSVHNAEENWKLQYSGAHDGWRAVAAAKKEAGNG